MADITCGTKEKKPMSIYMERPWTKVYDESVPASLEPYPEDALHEQLEKTANKYPSKAACITSGELPVFGRVGASVAWAEINECASEWLRD